MEDINANNFVISNAEITAKARESLKNRWGKSVLLMLLVFLLEFLIPVALAVLLPKKFTGLVNGLKPLLVFLCNAFLILWAVNLVKYQNAYTLASKMIQTLTEVYDRLILETGV